MGSQSPITLKMSSEFSTSTSNPRGSESFSLFGDGSCGEPLMAQHLVFDFTPQEEVDNDFVQRKCCAFWDFVNSQPELQKLMMLPELNTYRKNIETSDSSSEVELDVAEPIVYKRTAVSMLEIVEGKGLIDRTFEAKLPQSQCSLGSREYHENEATLPLTTTPLKDTVCICSGSCSACSRPRKATVASSSPAAADLCKKMQDWDRKHPKCRPICKSRRRQWKDHEQNTSAELLLERKPLAECFRRWPTKVYPNSPCPLFGRTKRVTIKEKSTFLTPGVVRICQAPVDDRVDTPYLRYADMAKRLGAWDAVHACCAFCECGACCSCHLCDYEPRDADRAAKTRSDMRRYDARVKTHYQEMKIMYDKQP